MRKIFNDLRQIVKASEISNLKLIYIGFLILLVMFLETLSIGILIPIVDLILSDELNSNINQIIELLNLDFNSKYNLLYQFSFLLILFFILKMIVLIYCNWYQTNFLVDFRIKLSRLIFKKYSNVSYEDSLFNNTSTILRDLNSESEKTAGIIKNSLIILTELLVISGIITLLFLVNMEVTLSVIIFMFFAVYFLIKLLQKKLHEWGSKRIFVDQKKNESIQNTFTGFKEIIINKTINFFYKSFDEFQSTSAKLNGYRIFIQTLPRLWIEFMVIITFSLIIIILKGNSIDELIKILSLFLISCLKLIPSANKIVTQLQGLKFFLPSVNRVNHIISNFEHAVKDDKKNDNRKKVPIEDIQFKNVNYNYKNQKDFVFNNLNLQINSGDCVGVYGKSGSGKSTFVNLISFLLYPKSGEIAVNNENFEISKQIIQNNIGYVSQNTFIFEGSVRDNIIFGRNTTGSNENLSKKIENSIRLSNLSDFINSLNHKTESILSENGNNLSGGQKQRLGIARALFNDPEILILDEATSALDENSSNLIMSEIYNLKKKKTLVIISHNLKNLYKCDYILHLEDQNITKKNFNSL